MPRAADGTYTLPTGSLKADGNIITAEWINTILQDLETEISDSLSRSGVGGFLTDPTYGNLKLTPTMYSLVDNQYGGLRGTSSYVDIGAIEPAGAYTGGWFRLENSGGGAFYGGALGGDFSQTGVDDQDNIGKVMPADRLWKACAATTVGTYDQAAAIDLFDSAAGRKLRCYAVGTKYFEGFFLAQTSGAGVGVQVEMYADTPGNVSSFYMEYEQWQSSAGPPTIVHCTAVNTPYGAAASGPGTNDRLHKVRGYIAHSGSLNPKLRFYDGSGAGAGSVTIQKAVLTHTDYR